jgi:hypothetical protein
MDQACRRSHRRGHRGRIAAIDPRHLDAIEHQVVAGRELVQQQPRDGRHARAEDGRIGAAFERRDLLFQHAQGRVGPAAVEVVVESREADRIGIHGETGGQHDGRRDRAPQRIGRLARMDARRLQVFLVLVAHHRPLPTLAATS